MKPEEQRIKIAEACGWSLNSDWQRPGIGKWWEHKEDIGNLKRFDNLPDYLNALHEAEEFLTRDQYFRYYHNLLAVIENGCLFAIRVPAEQRAEAFLRTLGLWEKKSPTGCLFLLRRNAEGNGK